MIIKFGSKSQVTIPAIIVHKLNLNRGDKINCRIEKNDIVLSPVRFEQKKCNDSIKDSNKKNFRL